MNEKDAAYNKTQIHTYLLCNGCEDKFSRYGEKHMGSIWSNEIDFPLLTMLKACPKIVPDCIDGIHLQREIYDSLIYFICSILWRSNNWPDSEFGSYRGALGKKYEAEFRGFLLGERSQPKIKLLISVNTNSNKYTNNWFYLPCVEKKGSSMIHSFFILGLEFNVLVGQLDPNLRNAFRQVQSDMLLCLEDTFNSPRQIRLAERVQFEIQKRGRLALKYPNK